MVAGGKGRSPARAGKYVNPRTGPTTVKISVIVPLFNEEQTVLEVLEKVSMQEVEGMEFETIVIDDGSTDGSLARLEERPDLYARLVALPRNRGKGGAVKAGLAVATGDYILFQDADLEYDPAAYRDLLFPIRDFDADVVMGSRMLAPTFTRVYYFWHKVGNRLVTLFFNVLNNTTFTDVYSCYLVYRRSLIDPAELRSTGWEQHAEILSKVVRRARVFYEVPATYQGRTYAEGKKIRAKDAISVLWMMFRERVFGRDARAVPRAAADVRIGQD